ncbi:uncharacterized protein LOC100897591 [Galendromus occidentalis]|uniref:Uncharacterized protein LOC100897591 n=1 Tax=Galendromus occidentalis TaxID=34638 RepID=A0AAJ6QSB1_9ACAR|nr:uncharacterized protein LOC100897591 [Galendromus occidentalis]
MSLEIVVGILGFLGLAMVILNVSVSFMTLRKRDEKWFILFIAAAVVLVSMYALWYVGSWCVEVLTYEMLDALRSIPYSNLHDDIFRSLRIHGDECRVKFICELTKITASKSEALTSFRRLLPAYDVDGLGSNYISGMLGGIRGTNCSLLFTNCDHSPLERTFPFLTDEL